MTPPSRLEDWHTEKLTSLGLLPGVLNADPLVIEMGGKKDDGIPLQLLAAARVVSAMEPGDVSGSTFEEVSSDRIQVISIQR